jgi:glyoxylase-like metal-dependent hydrolase (beta-lactamase superfamily II)
MKLSKNCFALTGLGFMPPWFVNAGIITGVDKTLIIDTGGNYNSAATIYGYTYAVSKNENLIVINTEPHFDHILGNCFFGEKCIPIYAHPLVDRTEEDFKNQKKEMNASITDMFRKNSHEEEAFFSRTYLKNPDYYFTNFSSEIPSASDNVIERIDWPVFPEVEIISTPGHTKANISVFHTEDKVIYTGDCIVNNYSPNLECGNVNDWKIWKKSLDFIKLLKPEIIVPGHGDVIYKKEIEKVLAGMHKFIDEAIRKNSNRYL